MFVAGRAVAVPPDGGHYVWVPPGATVVLVSAVPVTPADFARREGDRAVGSYSETGVRRDGFAAGEGDARSGADDPLGDAGHATGHAWIGGRRDVDPDRQWGPMATRATAVSRR
jgi:hypothetical protein